MSTEREATEASEEVTRATPLGADRAGVAEPARVIIRTGSAAGNDAFVGQELRLGASLDNGLRLPVRGVSRNHARIWKDGATYWLEDLSSTNGTFVNGQRIGRTRLRHLDVLTLGRNVDLIFLQRRDDQPAARPQRVAAAALEWLDGPLAGEKAEIRMGETSLGRDWSCNLPVEAAEVSGIHARLTRTADHVTVQDLGSTNGTRVNDVRVTGTRALNTGDVVTLAGVVGFRVTVERTAGALAGPKGAFETLSVDGFDQEWKTRLVWSPDELADLSVARALVREEKDGAAEASDAGRPVTGDGKAVAGRAAAPGSTASAGKGAVARRTGGGKRRRAGKAITGVQLKGTSAAHHVGVGRAVVGRDLDAEVWLDSGKVSRRHAVIEVTPQGVWVEDLDSANGTRVNGIAVSGKVAVGDGDEVTFGNTTMRLQFLRSDGVAR